MAINGKETYTGSRKNKQGRAKRPNLWKARLEIAVANLAVEVKKARGGNVWDLCRELNFKYCKKRVGIRPLQHYGATAMQLNFIKNTGY